MIPANSGNFTELDNNFDLDIYDHYSFDFWRTIGFSNPQFKIERTKLIQSYCVGVSEEFIQNIFSKIGREYNEGMEIHNHILSPSQLYTKVFNELNIPKDFFESIINDIYSSFFKYSPIIDPKFELFLKRISDKSSCSITSNTAFIPGKHIETFLNDYFKDFKFNFMLFSDVCKYAKPHNEIFDMMFNKAVNIHSNNDINVIHIGDNYDTDIIGARKFGLNSYLIKN